MKQGQFLLNLMGMELQILCSEVVLYPKTKWEWACTIPSRNIAENLAEQKLATARFDKRH